MIFLPFHQYKVHASSNAKRAEAKGEIFILRDSQADNLIFAVRQILMKLTSFRRVLSQMYHSDKEKNTFFPNKTAYVFIQHDVCSK